MKEIVNTLPDAPGCYIFLDSAGDCLYVGKSKKVRSRVRSYFGKDTTPKVAKLSKLIVQIEYRPAKDELDALYLEHSLIKTYRPPFNSLMKKDIHLHYICIEWDRATPGLYISDRPGAKVTRYGGFTSVYDAQETLGLLSQAWPIPTCELRHFDKKSSQDRACLNMHIGRCMGPCQQRGLNVQTCELEELSNNFNIKAYRQNLFNAAAFLQGRNKQVLADIKQEMKQAAIDMDFEKAASMRDTLHSLARLQRKLSYRIPFKGRKLCILIKGFFEPNFMIMYYKNGQLIQAKKFNKPEDWSLDIETFVAVIIGNEQTNLGDLDKLYTVTATQDINAHKYFIDITKTKKDDILRRLDNAYAKFIR